jgi:hypothetical protein
MIAIALSVLGPIILGLIVVHLLIPDEPRRLLVALLSVGVGFGISSWLVFSWLLVAGRASQAFVLLEAAAILVGAIIVYGRRKVRRPASTAPDQNKTPHRVFSLETALISGFAAVALAAAARYALATRMAPYGSFDAWESYNLKARFILLSGNEWKQLFTAIPDPVPDYPLFLPFTVAGILMSVARDTIQAPIAIAVIFICATVEMLLTVLGQSRSRSQAALAGMVLLGTPFFVHLSFAQYADIALSFFFLATMALLFIDDRRQSADKQLLVVAGLTAGLSGWVKNEGLVFFLAILITYTGFSWLALGRQVAVRRLRMFLYGGAVPILLALLYKWRFAGTNALVATQGRHGMLRKLLLPHRYLEVLEGFRYHLYHLASWPESILLILAVYALVLGISVKREERPALFACAATLLIMLGVYFIVLVGSPYDTPPFDESWYILVTAPRLFMQLWPGFLMVYFLIVRTPDDIIHLLVSRSEPASS